MSRARALALAALVLVSAVAGAATFAGAAASNTGGEPTLVDGGVSTGEVNVSAEYAATITATIRGVNTSDGTENASVLVIPNGFDLSNATIANADVSSTGAARNTSDVSADVRDSQDVVNVTWDDASGTVNDTLQLEFYVSGAVAPPRADTYPVEVSGDVNAGAADGYVSGTAATVTVVEPSAAGTINGTVTGPTGEAVPNVTVGAWNGSSYVATDWTGPDGTYDLIVPDGTFSLLVVQYNESVGVTYPKDGVTDIYAGPANASTDGTYDVTLPAVTNRQVRVVDDEGAPLADATVRIDGSGFEFVAETNADGYTVARNATEAGVEFAGSASLEVWPPDEPGLDSYTTGSIDAGANATTVVVERQPTASGQFVRESGEPVSNLSSVILYGQDWHFGEANASGNFSVAAPNGTYELGIEQDPSADGVPDLAVLGNVTVDGTTDLGTVTVPDANRVTATVVNESGAAVSGVPVVADLPDGSSVRLGETDADGTVTVEVANETELWVDSPWYNHSEATVSGTQNASVTLAVEPHVPVNVSVERTDESSVEGLAARKERADDDGGYHTSTTSLDDGVGEFSVEPGARWNYGVVQRFADYPLDGVPDVYAVANRSAPLDEGLNVTASVPDAHRLNVTVTDANGVAVANEDVVVASTRNGARVTVDGHTDGEGRLVVGDTPGVEVAGNVTVGLGTRFWDPERFDAAWSFDVTNDTTETVTAPGAVTSAASGRLVGPSGDPVNVSEVTLAGEETYRGDVGDGGNFTVAAPNGTYALGIEQERGANTSADGVPDLAVLGNVTVDGTTDLGTVTVPDANRVTAAVVDESGAAVSGVRVIAHTTAPPHATVTLGETNASGQLAAELLNETRIGVDDIRYNDSATTVSGANGTSVTLPVERHAVVTMNVTHRDGSPATMAARVQDGSGWRAGDLDDGRERFGVPPNESLSYGVTEQFRDYPLNGIPDVYAVMSRAVSLPGATINATVPDAHRLNVTVTDDSGEPVANESVVVAATRNGAHITAEGHTDGEGRLVVGDTPGVEVTGTVTVALGASERDSEQFRANWTLDVTNDTNTTVSTAATGDVVTVSGALSKERGTVTSTNHVIAVGAESTTLSVVGAPTSSGEYAVGVPKNTTQHLLYYETTLDPPAHDGSPDVFFLGNVTAAEDVTRAATTLPVGHVLNVSVVTESGAAASDARVSVANATADVPLLNQSVDADGRLNVSAAGTPGVELANGSYEVAATLANDTGVVVAENATTVTVAGDTGVTVTLDTSADSGGSDGSSGSGDDSGGDTTTDPTNHTVVDASLSATSATVNDAVSVSATVENAGDVGGNTTLVLTRDGSAIAQQSVSVAAGATETVTFERTLVEDGAHTFAVNGTTAGTVDVSLQRLGGTSAGSPGFGVLAGALAVVAAALLARRRD
ncbi:hypothetical protein EFA46_013080 (plasmid) [Halarchaeum sp. CBA1220]|uniref:hypothetical protein n=1 Tax=Halarchaeum sp. CBA1220 TaxID=1853682 RepID=UPI000F3A84E4|nr:hypothetical protein [Halarchaeum sp. CBA1220]QLC35178.1 hypothetical protein EFA46_013080 [Halarchaeum sp. CBA1220]